jgi:hypothetical protein
VVLGMRVALFPEARERVRAGVVFSAVGEGPRHINLPIGVVPLLAAVRVLESDRGAGDRASSAPCCRGPSPSS